MPFCPECGKSVGPSQKFCRNCGASLVEESPAVALPAPVPGTLGCRTCGAQLAPDEKFCGNCGAKTGEGTAAAAPAPAPVPVQPPAPVPVPPAVPAPVPAPVHAVAPAPPVQPAGRVCPSCGTPMTPDMKFCGSCGAPVQAAAAPAAPPAFAPPPPSAVMFVGGAVVCRACGNPIKPGDKFCSKCLVKVPEDLSVSPSSHPVSPPAYIPPPPPVSQAPPPPPPPAAVAAPAPATVTGALVCRACGNPIRPGDKFCSKCLVKVPDDLASAPATHPVSPPAYIPPPPPVSQAPPPPPPPPAVAAPAPATVTGALVCRACGNPIRPGDKFCSKCLVKVPDSPAAAPAGYQAPPPPAYQPPPPPPPQYAAPAPAPAAAAAPAAGGLVCRACGNPIRPGDKFCSKCLVKVPDNPAAAPAPYQAPPPPPAAAAPASYVCASCGSPVSGSEKFCGICGATVVATPVPVPAPAPAPAAPPAKKFCGVCGAALSGTTKFCGSCGAAVNPAPSGGGDSSFRPGSPVTAGGEEVIGVIANARKVKMFGVSYDTWNLVITSRRIIMVQMTQAMLNAAITEAQAQAKAEGKGFFGIMKDQMAAQFRFAVRYETMNPDTALAETPGNLSVENARVTAIDLKLRDSGSGEMEYTEFKMVIGSADGSFEYLMAEDDRYVNLLKQVYGDRVHMPFGYVRLGAAHIRFF